METFMTESLKTRRKGFIRTGLVKVLPIRRGSDWLPENSDSIFMNSGAKIEYVAPRNARTGQIVDPLGDLTEEQKNKVAKELGLKDSTDLNINKTPEKANYWINRHVFIDRNGKFLDLTNIGDFILYKILEVNLESIAPSFEERYNKGTYKFMLVFPDEEAKISNNRVDSKKDAYMMFGKMDGSIRKLSDFLWIYYLTTKEAKRLPNNPTLEFLRGEVGRIVDEKTGEFLSIVTDPNFETKALIQKSINCGVISRSGMTFQIFGEPNKNTLEDLIGFLDDDRNNNIRVALIGKIEAHEKGLAEKPDLKKALEEKVEDPKAKDQTEELLNKFTDLEKMAKEAMEVNAGLREKLIELEQQNTLLKDKVAKTVPKGQKTTEVKKKGNPNFGKKKVEPVKNADPIDEFNLDAKKE